MGCSFARELMLGNKTSLEKYNAVSQIARWGLNYSRLMYRKMELIKAYRGHGRKFVRGTPTNKTSYIFICSRLL